MRSGLKCLLTLSPPLPPSLLQLVWLCIVGAAWYRGTVDRYKVSPGACTTPTSGPAAPVCAGELRCTRAAAAAGPGHFPSLPAAQRPDAPPHVLPAPTLHPSHLPAPPSPRPLPQSALWAIGATITAWHMYKIDFICTMGGRPAAACLPL